MKKLTKEKKRGKINIKCVSVREMKRRESNKIAYWMKTVCTQNVNNCVKYDIICRICTTPPRPDEFARDTCFFK